MSVEEHCAHSHLEAVAERSGVFAEFFRHGFDEFRGEFAFEEESFGEFADDVIRVGAASSVSADEDGSALCDGVAKDAVCIRDFVRARGESGVACEKGCHDGFCDGVVLHDENSL